MDFSVIHSQHQISLSTGPGASCSLVLDPLKGDGLSSGLPPLLSWI